MMSYLQTMLAGLRQWITAHKPDWSQNDETAANFIKGRPCYEDDSGNAVPLPAKYLPTIPAEKLPTIPAKKLPTIPAEKLPDVFETKDLVVELGNFGFDTLTQSTQPSFNFSNVTYAELLDATKKSKVILKSVSRDFYVNQNFISCYSNGNIIIGISFRYGSHIHYMNLTCIANSTIFYRDTWSKVATE